MKDEQKARPWVLALAAALLLAAVTLPPAARAASETRTVVPVGRAVGIKLFSDGVMVVGFSEVASDQGRAAPARDCGLREGDIITHINREEVDTIEEVQAALQQAGDAGLSIRALRDDQTIQFTAHAVRCGSDGQYKLGAWIRDSMAGIGTVTFWDPESGTFGALGSGDFFQNSQAVAVADRDEVRTGPAVILSNVSGDEVREYAVEITRIFPQNGEDTRDLMLKVTDPDLLAATGGIVQGMSGSPILQDGKLVGAVTHVLVNSPEQGYGILAENMLRLAEESRPAGS